MFSASVSAGSDIIDKERCFFSFSFGIKFSNFCLLVKCEQFHCAIIIRENGLLSFVLLFQKIVYPPENEGDVSTARSIQKNSISGTIWGMCFISKDPCQPSKGHNPILTILLNRYDSYES